MGGGTGRLPRRDVKQDLAVHVYLSYLSSSVRLERKFAGTFFVPLSEAGLGFAQPGTWQKPDNFYLVDINILS